MMPPDQMEPGLVLPLAAETAPAWLPFAIIGAFLVVFPLFWCLIVGFLSLTGGWHRLARIYRAGDRPVSGQPYSMLNGMVGWVSYRFVLTVHIAEDGFFLEVMPLFRFAHPRLFIPWEAVGKRWPVNHVLWTVERFEIGHPPIATITLRKGLLPLSGN